MEQNILKRYNEIHIMLWEEIIKVFAARTREIRDIEYYRVNREQIKTLSIVKLKTAALFNLFVSGKITEQEKNNLLMSNDCAACYISHVEHKIQVEFGMASAFKCVCLCCPIGKWRNSSSQCGDYYTISDKIDYLISRIAKCIDGKEKFSLGAYTSLRKDIIKKMYIVAHLEWGNEENEV